MTQIDGPAKMDKKFPPILKRRRLAVLYGGWSAERSISLKSGAAVIGALKRLGVPFKAIDVSPRVAEDLRRHRINLAFLAVHGPFGEDGTLQGLLEMMGIAYTGCGVLASAVCMHKPTAKKIFQTAGLPTPPGFTVTDPKAPFPKTGGPWVVKPASQGSAVGVTIVEKSADQARAIRAALKTDREAVVEKRIIGTEITVGVLGGRTLPVVEIIPKHAFYDFYSKYAKGGSRHLVPSRLPRKVQDLASDIALKAFRAVGGRHFGRVDFMVDKAGNPWLLEINTLPGMTDLSLLPDAARAAGISFDELVLEMLRLSLEAGV
jgi:D-alanine-D-alanine ligase